MADVRQRLDAEIDRQRRLVERNAHDLAYHHHDVLTKLCDEIMAAPARSIEDLALKARAALFISTCDASEPDPETAENRVEDPQLGMQLIAAIFDVAGGPPEKMAAH